MSAKYWIIALAGLALPGTANAAAQLIQNGNFTSTHIAAGAPNNSGSFELDASGQYGTVDNWTTSNSPTNSNPYNILFNPGAGANVAQNNSTAAGNTSPSDPNNYAYTRYGSSEYLASGYGVTSPTGGNFMSLDGDQGVNGYLSQSVTGLTAGTVYALDFYWAVAEMASAQAPNGLSDALTVKFGTTSQTTNTMSIVNQGFSGWVKQTFYFTAQTATQTLSFLSIGAPAGQPPLALLDGVSLTAAPEPSTLAVLATGIGALAFFARRRRQDGVSAAA